MFLSKNLDIETFKEQLLQKKGFKAGLNRF